ncbi:MAG: dihydropteroate synthase [Kiritimatiellia bacterium]|jgi:dihydropteroate synthase
MDKPNTSDSTPSADGAAALCWRCCEVTLPLSRPLVMGILNVTPNSFSDGGRHRTPREAIAYGLQLVEEGADILDIGGESTHPGAAPVPVDEEIARVVDVIRGLAKQTPTPISIDTRNAAVARAALEAGAVIVNDITGLGDPEMRAVVRDAGAGSVIMHMQGEPRTMQQEPVYTDVVGEVYDWLRQRVDEVVADGIALDTLTIDPGIGFGKTTGHNLELLGALRRFAEMGPPLLMGLSRKRFIGEIIGAPVDERLPGSLTAMVWCIWHGAAILRVHDVRASVAAVRMATAIAGFAG